MKKIIIAKISIALVAIILFAFFAGCIHVNDYNRASLIFNAGKLVDTKEDAGVYFTTPFIGSSISLFKGERFYDVNTTGVITSDKKNLEVNAYSTWQITDPAKYYKQLNSVASAQARVENELFSAMKKVISSTTQDDVISGKDGSLSNTIFAGVNFDGYGIAIDSFEIKLLDLPLENKLAVYDRMISERNVIAASYKAEGDKEAATIKSSAEAKARTIRSDADATAAQAIAEGERMYYEILHQAYSASAKKTEFYKFWSELEALKVALGKDGNTIVITPDNPLYQILINNCN